MSFWQKSIRGALVALMLLVTGAAPLFTVSVDNDDDDDTPPVTVEFNLVPPSRRAMQLPAAEASRQMTATGHRDTFSRAVLASHHHPALELKVGSAQMVVPLRT